MINRALLIFFLLIIPSFGCCDKNDHQLERTESKFTIAIDVGHSKKHQGAFSSRGIGEYRFNFRLSKRLLYHLKQAGYISSFIINENGDDITLKERTEIAKNKKADILLSIHHDSVQPHYLKKWKYNGLTERYCDKFSGYSIFVSTINPFFKESLELSLLIGESLISSDLKPTYHHSEKIRGENKELLDSVGVYQFDNLAVLKSANMPAILIECGIIVNREEEMLLKDEVHIDLICSSLISAIETYSMENKIAKKFTDF